jgi:hypothetical protein
MECQNNTEIVIHDAGNSLHSFMYYTNNGNFRIGRNMGYGNGNLTVTGYIECDATILSKSAVYARNGYDTVIRSDSGGMYLEMGGIGNSDYMQFGAFSGVTWLNSKQNRSIFLQSGSFTHSFSTSLAYNASNSYYWNVFSDQRIKENIKKANIKICYENVKNINLYRFKYIDGVGNGTKHDKTQLGFVAQQVKQHFPKAVQRSKRRLEDKREIPDISSLDVAQINLSLFGAVKQLIKVVEKQSKRIKKLEEMLGIIDDDEVDNDADEPYERIVCDEVDIDTIEPSEPVGV